MHLIVWARPSSQTFLKMRCSWQKGKQFLRMTEEKDSKKCARIYNDPSWNKLPGGIFPSISLRMFLCVWIWVFAGCHWPPRLTWLYFWDCSPSCPTQWPSHFWLQLCLLGCFANVIFHKHYTWKTVDNPWLLYTLGCRYQMLIDF